tara:strand:+ start:84 stop:593 length:510 start_codon:yes stop_codon:yes gene_type:complete
VKKENLIHIGTFYKPVGLKGEINIINHTSGYSTFKSIDSYLNQKGESVWNFKYLKVRKNKLIGLLKGYENRNLSESLKGLKIFTDKRKFKKKIKNFIDKSKFSNFKVFNLKKQYLGNVINIDNFGAGNLINLKRINKKNIYIPMNNENVKEIDKNKKIIIVSPIKGIID